MQQNTIEITIKHDIKDINNIDKAVNMEYINMEEVK